MDLQNLRDTLTRISLGKVLSEVQPSETRQTPVFMMNKDLTEVQSERVIDRVELKIRPKQLKINPIRMEPVVDHLQSQESETSEPQIAELESKTRKVLNTIFQGHQALQSMKQLQQTASMA